MIPDAVHKQDKKIYLPLSHYTGGKGSKCSLKSLFLWDVEWSVPGSYRESKMFKLDPDQHLDPMLVPVQSGFFIFSLFKWSRQISVRVSLGSCSTFYPCKQSIYFCTIQFKNVWKVVLTCTHQWKTMFYHGNLIWQGYSLDPLENVVDSILCISFSTAPVSVMASAKLEEFASCLLACSFSKSLLPLESFW